MFGFRKLSIAIAVAAMACLGLLPSTAFAYPDSVDLQISLNVEHCFVGGTPIIAHARTTAGNMKLQGTTTIKIADKTYTKHSTNLTATYPTSKVTKKTLFKVTATFVPDSQAGTASAPLSNSAVQVTPASFTTSAMAAAVRNATTSQTVTLVSASPGCSPSNSNLISSSGALPNTGGTNIWYLVLGAALLTMGAGITVMTRNRRNIHKSL